MLLGKSLVHYENSLGQKFSSLCSSPRPKKELSRFKFPLEPKAKEPKDDKPPSPSPSGYHGLRNLAFILLTLFCCKLLMACFVTVPSVRFPAMDEILPKKIPISNYTLIVWPVFANLVTYFVERSVGYDQVKLEVANSVHAITIFITFLLPTLFMDGVKDLDCLMVNLFFNLVFIVLAMKMISYIHVNRTMRDTIMAANNNCREAEFYPSNLTYRNIFHHWVSTSLVYRPALVPNSDVKPRKLFILFKFMETMLLLLAVRVPFLIISDVVGSLMEAVSQDVTLLVIERFLTLSLVFFTSWLISFYIIFVSFLGMLSELVSSQDRVFYHAWWNASTMEEFWRWWNLPVHRWCVKHVYLPVVNSGMSKLVAMSTVFLFSAALHEYLISVPICVCGHFAFLGFLGQGIVCKGTQLWTQKCGKTAGNVLVWLILIFGNTTGIVIYYNHVVDSLKGEN